MDAASGANVSEAAVFDRIVGRFDPRLAIECIAVWLDVCPACVNSTAIDTYSLSD